MSDDAAGGLQGQVEQLGLEHGLGGTLSRSLISAYVSDFTRLHTAHVEGITAEVPAPQLLCREGLPRALTKCSNMDP